MDIWNVSDGKIINQFKINSNEIIKEVFYENSRLVCLSIDQNTNELILRWFNFNPNVNKILNI